MSSYLCKVPESFHNKQVQKKTKLHIAAVYSSGHSAPVKFGDSDLMLCKVPDTNITSVVSELGLPTWLLITKGVAA